MKMRHGNLQHAGVERLFEREAAKLAEVSKKEQAAEHERRMAREREEQREATVARLQQQLLPQIRRAEEREQANDLSGAVSIYEKTLAKFRAAGVERPKLQKISSARALEDVKTTSLP